MIARRSGGTATVPHVPTPLLLAPGTDPSAAPTPQDSPRRLGTRSSTPDAVFRSVIYLAGILVLLIMLMVGSFLAVRAGGALREAGW